MKTVLLLGWWFLRMKRIVVVVVEILTGAVVPFTCAFAFLMTTPRPRGGYRDLIGREEINVDILFSNCTREKSA
jgi:hypothetical protein